jgi:hypothetical protein
VDDWHPGPDIWPSKDGRFPNLQHRVHLRYRSTRPQYSNSASFGRHQNQPSPSRSISARPESRSTMFAH